MELASVEWGEMVANYTMGSNSRVRALRARTELGWSPKGLSLEKFISTSSILTINLFFKSLIKFSTKISGADAPDEIPIVFEF